MPFICVCIYAYIHIWCLVLTHVPPVQTNSMLRNMEVALEAWTVEAPPNSGLASFP